MTRLAEYLGLKGGRPLTGVARVVAICGMVLIGVVAFFVMRSDYSYLAQLGLIVAGACVIGAVIGGVTVLVDRRSSRP